MGFVHGQWVIGVDEVHDVHHCNCLSCAGQNGFQGCVSLLAVTFCVEDGETRWLKKGPGKKADYQKNYRL